jgi:glutathione S-transferase
MHPKLALYVTPMCGYCHYVMSFIQELGLDVEIHNIMADRNHLEDLFKARNRTTVPVLKITSNGEDQWLPESRNIMKYLQGLEIDPDS